MSAATKLPFNLTVDEFFDWCPEDGNRWELIDGEPHAIVPGTRAHTPLASLYITAGLATG